MNALRMSMTENNLNSSMLNQSQIRQNDNNLFHNSFMQENQNQSVNQSVVEDHAKNSGDESSSDMNRVEDDRSNGNFQEGFNFVSPKNQIVTQRIDMNTSVLSNQQMYLENDVSRSFIEKSVVYDN